MVQDGRNILKIGLDFHGVINANPDYFSGFSDEALIRGHEIHIITGGPYKKVADYLKNYNINYTQIFSITDYYEEKGEVQYFPNGEIKVPDDLWNSAKAVYCLTNNIDIHIDDTALFSKDFKTPFCRYDGSEKKCFVDGGFVIDLSLNANIALDEIEKYF